ncbi:TetR/AcrR family transcriptional regulator [Pseudonocardia sp. CA-107938]|uniref:TetR/AcrR family transcriptional regulator n=1 Tax=Pseudonocardia sp. CA-107938 TaxID=3240021 RepID=UPI003D8AC68B
MTAGRPAPAGPVWDRPEPPSRAALSPLSRERIVAAAIALADADGLGAVSLRKVGAALDAGPMRLYGYLSTKDELLDLMADAVHGEIELPLDAGWRETLRALATGIRAAALRHPWFTELAGGRPNIGPHALGVMEAALAALDRSGRFADIDEMMSARGTVTAYVIGAVRSEIAEQQVERASGVSEAEWRTATGPYLKRMLATGRYPTLARFVREGADRSAEEWFTAGLETVLDGLGQ